MLQRTSVPQMRYRNLALAAAVLCVGFGLAFGFAAAAAVLAGAALVLGVAPLSAPRSESHAAGDAQPPAAPVPPLSVAEGDATSSAAPRGFVAAPSDTSVDRLTPLLVNLLDALPDPALVLDRELSVIHANAAAHDIFPAMRRGMSVRRATRAPELGEALVDVLLTRERRTVLLQERIPVERRLDVALAPLAGSSPSGPAVLVVMHDISERERLEKMRTDFIAHASHELRTPLAALRGFIETLQGPARDDAAARERFLGIMSAEAGRMTRLLDDLLSLSRVEMRAHIPPTGRVDVDQTLAEVFGMLEPVATAAAVTLVNSQPKSGYAVRGDQDEIIQVFVNLIQNAIKYGGSGGKVEVVVSSDHRSVNRPMVRVAVVDEGPGIAEQHIPRLTERFYRVDDRSSREKGGTGLGLAIVKHILNRHGGELKVRSKVGEGTTFLVELPRES